MWYNGAWGLEFKKMKEKLGILALSLFADCWNSDHAHGAIDFLGAPVEAHGVAVAPNLPRPPPYDSQSCYLRRGRTATTH